MNSRKTLTTESFVNREKKFESTRKSLKEIKPLTNFKKNLMKNSILNRLDPKTLVYNTNTPYNILDDIGHIRRNIILKKYHKLKPDTDTAFNILFEKYPYKERSLPSDLTNYLFSPLRKQNNKITEMNDNDINYKVIEKNAHNMINKINLIHENKNRNIQRRKSHEMFTLRNSFLDNKNITKVSISHKPIQIYSKISFINSRPPQVIIPSLHPFGKIINYINVYASKESVELIDIPDKENLELDSLFKRYSIIKSFKSVFKAIKFYKDHYKQKLYYTDLCAIIGDDKQKVKFINIRNCINHANDLYNSMRHNKDLSDMSRTLKYYVNKNELEQIMNHYSLLVKDDISLYLVEHYKWYKKYPLKVKNEVYKKMKDMYKFVLKMGRMHDKVSRSFNFDNDAFEMNNKLIGFKSTVENLRVHPVKVPLYKKNRLDRSIDFKNEFIPKKSKENNRYNKNVTLKMQSSRHKLEKQQVFPNTPIYKEFKIKNHNKRPNTSTRSLNKSFEFQSENMRSLAESETFSLIKSVDVSQSFTFANTISPINSRKLWEANMKSSSKSKTKCKDNSLYENNFTKYADIWEKKVKNRIRSHSKYDSKISLYSK